MPFDGWELTHYAHGLNPFQATFMCPGALRYCVVCYWGLGKADWKCEMSRPEANPASLTSFSFLLVFPLYDFPYLRGEISLVV